MTTKVKAIPEGYHTVTPYLIIKDAASAIEFYKKAFNAIERFRMEKPGNKIGHAELLIGNSFIMLADEMPEMHFVGPQALGGSPVMLHIYVANVDAIFDQAIAAGGKSLKPVANQFYGDRLGSLMDPFGHMWSIATHVEDVSPEDLKQRFDKMACGAQ